eukprot:COSAG06_NODE_19604_length_831_cov_0.765027_2_plen_105_part_00
MRGGHKDCSCHCYQGKLKAATRAQDKLLSQAARTTTLRVGCDADENIIYIYIIYSHIIYILYTHISYMYTYECDADDNMLIYYVCIYMSAMPMIIYSYIIYVYI